MFTDIISKLEGLNGMERTVFTEMARVYDANLPDTLYLNQYQLDEQFGYTPLKWKEFLKIKEVDMLIDSEMAGIAEIGARRALERLQSGEASTQDIAAAKQLLDNSKLIKQKANQRPQVILTRIPAKGEIGKELIQIGE